mgnify:FL=1
MKRNSIASALPAVLLALGVSCNNYSGRADYRDNISVTWYGPIEFTEDGGSIFYKPGTEVITECSPCHEYRYKNYTIIRK